MNAPLAIRDIATRAKEASHTLASASTDAKNRVLLGLADDLERNVQSILSANAQDMQDAVMGGVPAPKLARLELTRASLAQLAKGLRQVASLPDPVGAVTSDRVVPSGLHVRRVRVPLGVVAMIYESRPGVTVDAFALCLKAGNACILKGGKEARHSNEALARLAKRHLAAAGLPEASMAAVSSLSRDDLKEMLALEGLIDLVIPRGGSDLIRFVADHSRIPTIQHYKGVCHIFVDASADLPRAVEVVATAKASAPATCNAAECVLVHRDIAGAFVPMLLERLAHDHVEVHAEGEFLSLAQNAANVKPATEADFGTEFLDLTLAAKVVGGLDEAIAHIRRFHSLHTDAILTGTPANADRFVREVGSSCVLVNASTRFNDGFQLGLGAEIGISTSKIHAFGPMGLEELTVQRFVATGDYQTR